MSRVTPEQLELPSDTQQNEAPPDRGVLAVADPFAAAGFAPEEGAAIPGTPQEAPSLEALAAQYEALAAELRRNGHVDAADHVQAWATQLRQAAQENAGERRAPHVQSTIDPGRPIVPVLLFDAAGHSIPAGGPDLGAYDLAAWVVREKFWNPLLPDAPLVILTAILPGGGIWPLPDPALGACVYCIDRGDAVAVFAQEQAAVDAAVAVISPLVGGAGHA